MRRISVELRPEEWIALLEAAQSSFSQMAADAIDEIEVALSQDGWMNLHPTDKYVRYAVTIKPGDTPVIYAMHMDEVKP